MSSRDSWWFFFDSKPLTGPSQPSWTNQFTCRFQLSAHHRASGEPAERAADSVVIRHLGNTDALTPAALAQDGLGVAVALAQKFADAQPGEELGLGEVAAAVLPAVSGKVLPCQLMSHDHHRPQGLAGREQKQDYPTAANRATPDIRRQSTSSGGLRLSHPDTFSRSVSMRNQ